MSVAGRRLDAPPTAIRPTSPGDAAELLEVRRSSLDHLSLWEPERDAAFLTEEAQRAALEADRRDWDDDRRFAFDRCELHRVQAAVIPRNTASLGVVRRAGLRHEGSARHYLQIAGRWEDHEIYAAMVEDRAAMGLTSLT